MAGGGRGCPPLVLREKGAQNLERAAAASLARPRLAPAAGRGEMFWAPFFSAAHRRENAVPALAAMPGDARRRPPMPADARHARRRPPSPADAAPRKGCPKPRANLEPATAASLRAGPQLGRAWRAGSSRPPPMRRNVLGTLLSAAHRRENAALALRGPARGCTFARLRRCGRRASGFAVGEGGRGRLGRKPAGAYARLRHARRPVLSRVSPCT